jgi:tetratricopeptide (TPR) repeat protein
METEDARHPYTKRPMDRSLWTRPSIRLLLRRAAHAADTQPSLKRLLANGSPILDLVRGGEATNRGTEKEIPKAGWQRLDEVNSRFQSELSFADSFLAEDPPSSRIAVLLANSSELRRTAILQRSLESVYNLRLFEPAQGLRISEDLLAWTQEDPSPLVSGIRTRALMEHGNLCRILGKPEEAYSSLATALGEIEDWGNGDPLEVARLQELLGTLEKDCGNFEAAARLLRKAVMKIRRWGDHHSLQRVLIASAIAEIYCGNFDAAHALLDESLRTEEPDSVLLRIAAVNKVLAYNFSGEPHRAYQSLLRVRGNLGSCWMLGFPERQRIRVLWIEAQILSELRLDEDAIALFKRVRDFFIQSARGYEVCIVSLEIALSYASQRKFKEVPRELAFALPFLSAHKALDRYAQVAILLLQGAFERQGRLEAEQIRVIAIQLDSLTRAPLSSRRPRFADLSL